MPVFYWEHRPPTKNRHGCMFVAIFSISLLLYLVSFVSFSVSLSGVPWPSYPPLPYVPWDGLTGDGFWRYPKRVPYSPPFCLLYFIFYWWVFDPFPKCSVGTLFDRSRCKILCRHLSVLILVSLLGTHRHLFETVFYTWRPVTQHRHPSTQKITMLRFSGQIVAQHHLHLLVGDLSVYVHTSVMSSSAFWLRHHTVCHMVPQLLKLRVSLLCVPKNINCLYVACE